MTAGNVTAVVAFLALVIFGLTAVRTVPPLRTYVVERLGRYQRTLEPGLHLLIPLIESVRAKVNMGLRVARFPPQPAITSDDLVACIDATLHYHVVDAVRATYAISNARQAMEMLTITILRDLTRSMDLEHVRASRDEISMRLADRLDENTDAWGIEVILAEINAVEIGSRLGCA